VVAARLGGGGRRLYEQQRYYHGGDRDASDGEAREHPVARLSRTADGCFARGPLRGGLHVHDVEVIEVKVIS